MVLRIDMATLPYLIVPHPGNPSFAERVAAELHRAVTPLNHKTFADGEMIVQLGDNIRRREVYLVYSPGEDRNFDLVATMVISDALRRSGAAKNIIVSPYLPFCRQDRKCSGRQPISAAMTIGTYEKMCYADRVICVDLHNASIQGMGTIPIDNLSPEPLFIKYIMETIVKKYHPETLDNLHNSVVVVSPDEGGAKRSSHFTDDLNAALGLAGKDAIEYVTMYKQRDLDTGAVAKMVLRDDVSGKVCIIIDDMIGTGGTLCRAVEEIKKSGASHIYALATHGLLNDKAPEKIEASYLDEVVVTNTVKIGDKRARCTKLRVLDISEMIASAISRNNRGESMDELFTVGFYRRPISMYTMHGHGSALDLRSMGISVAIEEARTPSPPRAISASPPPAPMKAGKSTLDELND